MSQQAATFFRRAAPHAIATTSGTGLFPSIALAQAALESRFGQSILANRYNNLFGIKARPGDLYVTLPTWEVINGRNVTVRERFAVYESFADSFRQRLRFLKANPRYTKWGVFSARDYRAQARALQAAGYATDPKYATKLISLVQTYKLAAYDEQAKKKEKLSAFSSSSQPLALVS